MNDKKYDRESPEGASENSLGRKPKVESAADDKRRRRGTSPREEVKSAAPSGLDVFGLIPGASAPGYVRSRLRRLNRMQDKHEHEIVAKVVKEILLMPITDQHIDRKS
jgi:hypothetical protein